MTNGACLGHGNHGFPPRLSTKWLHRTQNRSMSGRTLPNRAWTSITASSGGSDCRRTSRASRIACSALDTAPVRSHVEGFARQDEARRSSGTRTAPPSARASSVTLSTHAVNASPPRPLRLSVFRGLGRTPPLGRGGQGGNEGLQPARLQHLRRRSRSASSLGAGPSLGLRLRSRDRAGTPARARMERNPGRSARERLPVAGLSSGSGGKAGLDPDSTTVPRKLLYDHITN